MIMTSRERVTAAVDHREPDQVPIDFGGHRSSGIMALGYKKLREYLGLPKKPIKIYDMIQQLAVVDNDVLDRFGVDTIEMGRGFALDDKDWKEWTMPDGTEVLIPSYVDVEKKDGSWVLKAPSGIDSGVQREGMIYFDQIYWPYKDGVPEEFSGINEALADVMWSVPSPPNLEKTSAEEAAAGAKKLRESTDRYIVFLFGGNLLEISSFLCSIPEFMMLMAAEPDKTHKLLDALVEIHKKNIDTFVPAVAPYIDNILFGDDLGMQSGPQISPDMYREYFKPRHEELWKYAKKVSGKTVQLHSCGGLRPLLNDLIDAGLDAVNPVQISSAGMDAAELKQEFGDRLCLWGGGCDTQHVLPNGTPEEVRSHVLKQCEILQPGGGFVFQQVHNIMANVPPENIVTMFDAVAEFNGKK
mgnify:CR=1 FL=1